MSLILERVIKAWEMIACDFMKFVYKPAWRRGELGRRSYLSMAYILVLCSKIDVLEYQVLENLISSG